MDLVSRGNSLLSVGSGPGKNVIFGADMSSLVQFWNREKRYLNYW